MHSLTALSPPSNASRSKHTQRGNASGWNSPPAKADWATRIASETATLRHEGGGWREGTGEGRGGKVGSCLTSQMEIVAVTTIRCTATFLIFLWWFSGRGGLFLLGDRDCGRLAALSFLFLLRCALRKTLHGYLPL